MIALPRHGSMPPPRLDAAEPPQLFAMLGRSFADCDTLEAGLAAALADLARVTGARSAGLFGCAGADGTLVRQAAYGRPEALDPQADPCRSLLRRCLAEDHPDRWSRSPPGAEPVGIAPHALLCVPLTLGKARLGAIVLGDGPGESFQERDLRILEAAAVPLALALSNLQLSTTVERQDGVKRELELAAEIQRNLLPQTGPGEFPVHGLNRPIRKVSGDFFDYFLLDERRIPFALGDVSGKGINAALLMAKAASLFRCLAKRGSDPAALLAVINREICETASHGMFVTMVAGLYDSTTGRVRFANAGHEPPLLRLPDRSYRSFPADAPPLGILPELEFETGEINLEGGELYLYSDGLTESRYGTQEALGVEGLVQLIESLAELPLAERLGALLAELDHEGWEARDDLTVLAIDDAWVRRHA